jgi:hypothetical protein
MIGYGRSGTRTSRAVGRSAQSGYSIAEMPAAIWVLFVCLLFPLLILVTTTIRASFLSACAKDAAHAAAKAKIFENSNAQPGDPPDAITMAVNQAQATAQALGGSAITIEPGDVKTEIVTSTLASPPTVSFSSQPLQPGQLDAVNNVYAIQVTVTGNVQPLVTFPKVLGDVPGLTGPIKMNAVAREMVENPQMLLAPSGGGGGGDGGGGG